MDLGAGALANLLRYVEPDQVSGLALSHLHYDHFVDLYGLCIARRYWESDLPPLQVILPAGSPEKVDCLPSEREIPAFLAHLELIEAGDGSEKEFGGLLVTTASARHFVEAISVRVASGDRAVCYTGDTEMNESLVTLAAGADLLICEANSTSEAGATALGHMTAREAGELATVSGVGTLLITHVWPTLDREVALRDAAATFKGPVALATEGLALDL
jgi:ribonuclease BN (tRNA processing enzyme)